MFCKRQWARRGGHHPRRSSPSDIGHEVSRRHDGRTTPSCSQNSFRFLAGRLPVYLKRETDRERERYACRGRKERCCSRRRRQRCHRCETNCRLPTQRKKDDEASEQSEALESASNGSGLCDNSRCTYLYEVQPRTIEESRNLAPSSLNVLNLPWRDIRDVSTLPPLNALSASGTVFFSLFM